jgi:hypothetical protein
MTNKSIYLANILIFQLLFQGLAVAQPYSGTPRFIKTNIHPKHSSQQLDEAMVQNIQHWEKQISSARKQIQIAKAQYETELKSVLKKLNSMRNPYYQSQVYWIAQGFLGKNIYHDYAGIDKETNEDANTCANGWCQVMAETTVPTLQALASGSIKFLPKTIAQEKTKYRPNSEQKKPKYIHVGDIIKNAESLGFLPIDLDLAQRGDFAIQYYRHPQRDNKFAAQHISIIDIVILRKDGKIEIRDWHEGIEGLPFIYRTASNLPSSHNNLFLPENIYYGYQNERGKERALKGKNPNVSQAYAYFGYWVEQAKPLLAEINAIREQLSLLELMEQEILAKITN